MQLEHNKSLKSYNTFGIDARAKHFIAVDNLQDLKAALLQKDHPNIFILGGGSNMLLTGDINALVLHIDLKGKSIIRNESNYSYVKAAAGENWHEFVLWTLENGLGGLENLSLIPGNVGTSPIQNIGAYGVELKDTFVECEAMNTETGDIRIFHKEECEFGYRDSVFKGSMKGQYVITSVTFKLSNTDHKLNTSYGAIEAELKNNHISNPGIRDVANAVIAIRKSKLPDPAEIGNSGSFFKNPVIGRETFIEFISKHPEAPHYIVSEQEIKVPAGWLIEKCGYKGKRFGDAGVHAKQALVLVNYGNATGQEILNLAQKIQSSVKEEFDIDIVPEVNII